MSRRQLPRAAATILDAAAFLPGEVAIDLTNDEMRYAGDGGELGGIALARKDGTNISVTATGSSVERSLADIVSAGWQIGVFRPVDYLSPEDWAAAQAFDIDAQDESAVALALQEMHDDVLAWVQADDYRAGLVQYGSARFAVDDSVISDTFYAAIWAQTNLGPTKSILLSGAGPRGTKFQAKNFVSAVKTYAAGPLNGETAPRAIFPIHCPNANRCAFAMKYFEVSGERDPTTDPIGVWGKNLLDNEWRDVSYDELSNTALFIEGIYNSTINYPTVQTVGLQPLNCGEINGARSGFPSRTATFTLTDLGGGSVQIDASESYFLAAHATNTEDFVINNGRTVGGVGQPLHVTITAYTSATRVTGTCSTTSTINAGASKVGTFLMMRCATTADSDQVTLDYPLDLDDTEVGRYVMIPKAGSKQNTSLDCLVARITAISLDKKTLTLSHQARASVSGMPLVLAPSVFVGNSEDSLEAGDTSANDITIIGMRTEYSHGYTDAQSSAVQLVAQNVLLSDWHSCKTHAANVTRPNYGQGEINCIFDNCAMNFDSHQFTHGFLSPTKGGIWIMGEYTRLTFSDCFYGQWRAHGSEAIFFIDPKTSDTSKTRVNISGSMEQSELSKFLASGNSGQSFIRYGANGSAAMVHAGGGTIHNAAGEIDVGKSQSAQHTTLRLEKEDSATSTVVNLLTLAALSSGTPAGGFGAGINFEAETTAGNVEIGAQLNAVVTTTTLGSEAFALAFRTMTGGAAATEVMRLHAAGALTLGSGTANQFNTSGYGFGRLQVNHASNQAGLLAGNWQNAAAVPATLQLYKSKSGTVGTRGIVASGDDLGAVVFAGDDGTNFIPAAVILAESDGAPGTNDMPGRLSFHTTADGAATPTERMRIAANGLVTTSASVQAHSATAIPAGGTAGAGLMVSSAANFGVFFGSGAPTLAAAKGSLYLRSDGSGTSNRAYINTDGSTTWTALTTAA